MKALSKDEIFMTRAMELAKLGIGSVSPNPLVGCVVVCDDQIIGEGWHQEYGKAHAEVNAINSVKDKDKLKESTVYVNLEPCSHFGKTPPCADLLVKCEIKRVVVANTDPNPKVSGRGLRRLRDANIQVDTGVLAEQGKELNKRFFSSIVKGRPYVILKWAETSDGFIAREDYDSKWISNEFSRQLVHKWRAEEGAILVGKNTAKYDNPSLTVRDWNGKNPIRIIIDHELTLEQKLNLFDQSVPTICYNSIKDFENGVSYVSLPDEEFLQSLLIDVNKRGINSVIIEGGAKTLADFIEQNLWDEARVFISKQNFETGISAPSIRGVAEEEIIHTDRLLIYKNH